VVEVAEVVVQRIFGKVLAGEQEFFLVKLPEAPEPFWVQEVRSAQVEPLA
jgi:hypothetical protein